MHIFFSKNPNFFASTQPSISFFMAKLMRTKQLIDCGLNTSKTEILLFKTRNKIITKHLNFCIRGQEIELSKSVKYLGIILQLDLY